MHSLLFDYLLCYPANLSSTSCLQLICLRTYFTTDYERDNPVTSSAGCECWDLYIKTKSPKKYISFNPLENEIQYTPYTSNVFPSSQSTPCFRKALLAHYRQVASAGILIKKMSALTPPSPESSFLHVLAVSQPLSILLHGSLAPAEAVPSSS